MAILSSLDGKDVMTIHPYRYEHSGEDWVITEIHFDHEGKNIVKAIGSYFELSELTQFSKKLSDLFRGDEREFHFQPLEPNFTCRIQKIDTTVFQVEATFAKEIRQKPVPESSCSMRFEITGKLLLSFVQELEEHIRQIQPAATLPA